MKKSMGVGVSLLNNAQSAGTMLFASLNIVVLVQLLAKGSDRYVANLGTDESTDTQIKRALSYTDARLRLETAWTVIKVVSTATALKLVLEDSLADQIIAAWFVGQGFALQQYVQSFISGMSHRNNTLIWHAMYNGADVRYTGCKDNYAYKLVGQTTLSITLQATITNSSPKKSVLRTLPWTAVSQLTVTVIAS
tara:strand:+ start:160 stop:741 length:582 start_codon:yes stop_codon:yes gene_type:complete